MQNKFNLSRNYYNEPLKKGEYPDLDDFKRLFLEKGLTRKECAKAFNCTEEKIKITCKKFNIHKNAEQRNATRKRTTLEKYGVENVSQLKEIKDKKAQTCLENYGVENPAQSKEVYDKIRKTCLDTYGVESSNATQEKKDKIKETLKQKYGVENIMHVFNVKEKQRQTNLEKYGVENPQKNADIKAKREQTNLERYGKENMYGSEYFKQKSKETCLEKYGVDNVMKTPEMQERFINIKEQIIEKLQAKMPETLAKAYQTKKEHNSFHTSKPELRIKELLESKFEIYYQYRNENYPYTCDFYLPDLDLYIEFQGSWTHGSYPYVETEESCIKKLAIWKDKAKTSKFYANAITTWTKRDVAKRNWAKEHKLNWLEFFTETEFMRWFNGL